MAADLDQDVVAFVRQVTGAMGLEVTIELEETPDHVHLNLTGNGADVLLKRQGDTLDALQVLINTVFRRHERGDRHYVVDALGFRRDKDRELRHMATFLVEKARTTGLVQQIGPLNPYARRIVHLAVAEHPDVTSESVGDAFLKTVMISSRAR